MMNSQSINNFFNFIIENDLTAIIKSDNAISYKELFDQSTSKIAVKPDLKNKIIKK